MAAGDAARPDHHAGHRAAGDDDPLGVFITRLEARGERRVGVKDLFDTAGVRTTYGSRIFADHVPTADAVAVRRLLERGWTLAGKTNLHEFAFGTTSDNPWYGPVRNPFDVSLVAGGSSGGSAAGVAAGLFELGLGSDTGGSIRVPAAACGVVGYKPARGAIPLDGCFPLVPWLDHVGPITADVATCVAAFADLTGTAPVTPVEPSTLRIGAFAGFGAVDAAIASVCSAALARVEAAGASVAGCDLPPLPAGATPLRMAAAATIHEQWFPERRDEYGADVARKLDEGRAALAAGGQADWRREVDWWRADFEHACEGLDLVAMPTLALPPPAIGTAEDGVRARLLSHTQPFNFLGWPAISLPAGLDSRGLPVGLQLAGRDDALVLGAALALERAVAGG